MSRPTTDPGRARRVRRSPAALAAAVLLAAGCAGPRAPRGPAGGGLAALVDENDLPRAEAALGRAAARSPRDPWARLGAALLARRALDGAAEATHLLAAVEAAPQAPLALVALRRLAELAEESPARAEQVAAGAAALLGRGVLGGPGAYRARVAAIAAAEVLGDHPAASRLRAENGSVTAWTVAGPFAEHHALDFDLPTPADEGRVPAEVPAANGLPAYASRPLPAPDGTVALEGEPGDADVLAVATDVTLARGGAYLLAVGTQLSARVLLDGALLLDRRAFLAHLPAPVQVPVALAAGRHRLVVKLSRGAARTGLHVALARADGAPADAAFEAAAPGSPPPAPWRAAAGAPPEPVLGARALAAALEPGAGPVLARLLAGRDALTGDREAAKSLLAEAVAARPRSAALRAALADARRDDRTLDERVAAARAESELREALRLDPGDAEARVELGALLRAAERLDDADETLAALPAAAAARPAALAERARVARDRGLVERAEGLVAEAEAAGGSCDAAEVGYELATRRLAVAREDALAAALARCRGGRERLAAHLHRRGDLRGELDALAPLVAARPWALDPAFARAAALVAAGDAAGAARAAGALAAIWPRSARIWKRVGDLRELAGDLSGARAARERALVLDGGDLALRRGLALEDGTEVLAARAEDGRAAIRAYEAAGRRADTSSAMVLDAAALEVVPGADAIERTHQVTHVIDAQGVERLGEVTIPAGADVLALRTLKPDGRALEPERAGGAKGSVSLAGLAVGDYVEVEYLRAVRGRGGALGFAADPFYFRVAGVRLFRSVYDVSAPEGLGLEVTGRGMPAPEPVRAGGRTSLHVERRDVPALVPEPDAPGGSEYLPHVGVGVGGGAPALQRAIADAVLERTRSTEELRALAREIRAAAGPGAGPAALVRAAYARVARTVLGQGGGLGEDASVVLSRGRGSRLVVLQAVLAELGIRARAAVVRPFSADPGPHRFPGPGLYRGVLLRVDAGGAPLWLDPSSRHMPFGALPSELLDAEALVLPAPGEPPEAVRTPPAPLVPDRHEIEVAIAVAADGTGTMTGRDAYSGATGAELKAALERLDVSQRRQAVEAMLARSFRGIAVDEVAFEGEDDPERPGVVRWKGRVPELGRAAGDRLAIEAPILPTRLGSHFVQLAARETPLLVPEPERLTQRIVLEGPPGLAPAADAPRAIETPFGAYTRAERMEGARLVREERLELARGRVPPERYPDFAAFAAAVDGLQERPVVFGR